MSDHILSAILTFSVLAGGTAAIGTELFNTHRSDKAAQQVVTSSKAGDHRGARATARWRLETVDAAGGDDHRPSRADLGRHRDPGLRAAQRAVTRPPHAVVTSA